MTFAEKYQVDHPDSEKESICDTMTYCEPEGACLMHCLRDFCYCWGREMPEEEPHG